MRYLLITYATQPGGQIDEVMAVSKNLKNKDLQMCNVIMDFAERKIVKCTIDGTVQDTDWEKLRGYYIHYYPSIIERLETEAESYKK